MNFALSYWSIAFNQSRSAFSQCTWSWLLRHEDETSVSFFWANPPSLLSRTSALLPQVLIHMSAIPLTLELDKSKTLQTCANIKMHNLKYFPIFGMKCGTSILHLVLKQFRTVSLLDRYSTSTQATWSLVLSTRVGFKFIPELYID